MVHSQKEFRISLKELKGHVDNEQNATSYRNKCHCNQIGKGKASFHSNIYYQAY